MKSSWRFVAAGMVSVWIAGIAYAVKPSAQAVIPSPPPGAIAGTFFKNVTTSTLKTLTVDDFIAAMGVMNWFHVVHTDGRTHPADRNPQWFGYSVGRWDGDTLTVDTIGFNGWTRLDTVGHPHSAALHLTQTFRRTDTEHIAYSVTVDDPVMYTRPWKNERTFTALKGDLIEYSCEENNKDLREGHIKMWTPPGAR